MILEFVKRNIHHKVSVLNDLICCCIVEQKRDTLVALRWPAKTGQI